MARRTQSRRHRRIGQDERGGVAVLLLLAMLLPIAFLISAHNADMRKLETARAAVTRAAEAGARAAARCIEIPAAGADPIIDGATARAVFEETVQNTLNLDGTMMPQDSALFSGPITVDYWQCNSAVPYHDDETGIILQHPGAIVRLRFIVGTDLLRWIMPNASMRVTTSAIAVAPGN